MASIKISDLCPSGSDLSVNSESFCDELNESDLVSINGGGWFIPLLVGVALMLYPNNAN